jgi:sigma-B regulation protein RsbU (phosphoserine phosphatase)
MRLLLRQALEKLGHDFVEAEDGQMAWEIYQREHFPVLITDWQMPRLDGLQLCQLVRNCPREQYTYVIVLTSLDSRVNYLEAIQAGTDDFLTKPFEDDLLGARLLVAERLGGLLTQAKQMEGLFPICPQCRKIRADDRQWIKVEDYLSRRLKHTVVQGACPACNKAQRDREKNLLRNLRGQS